MNLKFMLIHKIWAFIIFFSTWLIYAQNPLKEEDIVKSLIDKSTTLDTMVITRILSERSTNALGDFEVTYTYDPVAVKIVEE